MTEHAPLSPEDREWLDPSRGWVKGHFTDHPNEKYEPVEGKLRVVEAVLGWVAPSETWKLQSLGVAFGDALAQELVLEWVVVDDEFGRSLGLNWPGTSVYSFPTTTISKRAERGDTIDVRELFAAARANLTEMAFSGRFV